MSGYLTAAVVLGMGALLLWLRHVLARTAKRRASRADRLAVWRAREGLNLDAARVDGFGDRFPQLPFLNEGDGQYAYHVAHGTSHGMEVWAFDHHHRSHREGYGKKLDHWLSAVVVRTPHRLGPLEIRSRGDHGEPFHPEATESVRFESAAYNERFEVRAAQRRWAYDVIDTCVMELLLEQASFRVSLAGPDIAVWREPVFEVEEFATAHALATSLANALPPDLEPHVAPTRATP